jgi:hypothetical protein
VLQEKDAQLLMRYKEEVEGIRAALAAANQKEAELARQKARDVSAA